jgi:hemin uptake protein HemP
MQATQPPQPPAPAANVSAELPLRIESSDLLRGQKTVEIEHGKQRYTLRVTKDDKLILTK